MFQGHGVLQNQLQAPREYVLMCVYVVCTFLQVASHFFMVIILRDESSVSLQYHRNWHRYCYHQNASILSTVVIFFCLF